MSCRVRVGIGVDESFNVDLVMETLPRNRRGVVYIRRGVSSHPEAEPDGSQDLVPFICYLAIVPASVCFIKAWLNSFRQP
ncbi:hypothetical protein J6590_048091 [Homalodisca vitripennis]|nr:hypothetical protein J6590_048091 [Homalodisca vitripennis]